MRYNNCLKPSFFDKINSYLFNRLHRDVNSTELQSQWPASINWSSFLLDTSNPATTVLNMAKQFAVYDYFELCRAFDAETIFDEIKL